MNVVEPERSVLVCLVERDRCHATPSGDKSPQCSRPLRFGDTREGSACGEAARVTGGLASRRGLLRDGVVQEWSTVIQQWNTVTPQLAQWHKSRAL